MIVRTDLFANKVVLVVADATHASVLEGHLWHSGVLPNGNILCLIKESEDFEAADAYDESAQKGRETTELLTVNAAFLNVMGSA